MLWILGRRRGQLLAVDPALNRPHQQLGAKVDGHHGDQLSAENHQDRRVIVLPSVQGVGVAVVVAKERRRVTQVNVRRQR